MEDTARSMRKTLRVLLLVAPICTFVYSGPVGASQEKLCRLKVRIDGRLDAEGRPTKGAPAYMSATVLAAKGREDCVASVKTKQQVGVHAFWPLRKGKQKQIAVPANGSIFYFTRTLQDTEWTEGDKRFHGATIVYTRISEAFFTTE